MARLPAANPDMPWIEILDSDHVRTLVDGDLEVFSRSHVYNQMFGSGLAFFGPVQGDWRSIEAIADDITATFREIDRLIEVQK